MPWCSAAMMTQCIRPRAGARGPLALPMIPYMRANLARKRRGLAAADAIVAVSSTIAADLRARAPELAGRGMDIIPESGDIAALRARAAAAARPAAEPYALYLGKLAPNKGTTHLVVVERAGSTGRWWLPAMARIARAIEAAARSVVATSGLIGWVDQRRDRGWLAHASVLIFPSRGPESLEPRADRSQRAGHPDRGDEHRRHTRHHHRRTDRPALGHAGRAGRRRQAAAADDALRRRLGAAARFRAESQFDAPAVVARIERLYVEFLERTR